LIVAPGGRPCTTANRWTSARPWGSLGIPRPEQSTPRTPIADIRFASTLEFMAVMDNPLPQWAIDYRNRVEAALGDAYSGVAAEVRGFIAHVRGS